MKNSQHKNLTQLLNNAVNSFLPSTEGVAKIAVVGWLAKN